MEYNIEDLLVALAHRNRLKILKEIVSAGQEGLIVGAAAELVPVKSGTISYHLKKMLKAGLLLVKESGRFRIYKVNPEGVEELINFLNSTITGT